jgi:chromatin-remodeling ATPase INO80
MTGAPYGIHSPTQQSPFAVYSPPSKNRTFYPGNEQYQHPPEAPQGFPPPSAFARSPHFGHPSSPLPTTLPPLNGSVPPHGDPSSAYPPQHPSSGTPQFALPRPYSGSVMSGNASASYGQATSSHAHPSRSEALSQSPKKEPEPHFDARGNGVVYSSQPPLIREPRPTSPKESVCVCVCVWASCPRPDIIRVY